MVEEQAEVAKKPSKSFSVRLTDEEKDMVAEIRQRLKIAGKKASAGEVLRIGLFLMADFKEREIKALMNGGELEIKIKER